IACLGLLNDNPVVVIGAMLIAPALFPILALGMAAATFSRHALMRSLKVIGLSFVIVVGSSAIMTALFLFMLNTESNQTIQLTSSPNLALILVAMFSGVIASYAWIKQSQSALLPGVAIAVSLVPPLANIGIGLTAFDLEIFTGSLLIFLLNLIGIFFGSL